MKRLLQKLTPKAKSLMFVALIAGVFSCRAKDVGSHLSIDSGLSIKASHNNKVSGVVSIGGCTATLVSANTLMTAAHCVTSQGSVGNEKLNTQICIQSPPYNGKCSSNVYAFSGFNENWGMDMAIAIFDGTPFQHIFPIENQEANASPGRPVALVGYSGVALETSEFGSKRWGKNTIFQLNAEEFNSITTVYRGNSDSVAVSPGDSGGAMFASCRLIGVTSRMSSNGSKTSLHTNLTVQKNKDWMKTMEAKGAHFCTNESSDATYCPQQYMYKELSDPPKETDGQIGFPCALDDKPDPSINVFLRAATKGSPAPEDHVLYFATGTPGEAYGYCKSMPAEDCKVGAPGYTAVKEIGKGRRKHAYKLIDIQKLPAADSDYWTFVVHDAQKVLLNSRSIQILKKN